MERVFRDMSDFSSFVLYCLVFTFASAMLGYGMTRRNIMSWDFSVTGLLILILFSGLRWKVGSDFIVYFDLYRSYAAQPFSRVLCEKITEPFYPVLCKTVSVIFDDCFQGFIAVQILFFSLIIIASLKAIKKLNLDGSQFIAIFTFCFGLLAFSYNGMRQGGACALVLLSISYVFSGERRNFFICILLATLVHNSAIIGIVFWFVWNWETASLIDIKYIALLMVPVTLLFFTLPGLFTMLENYIPQFSRYAEYLTTEVEGANLSSILRFMELVLFIILYPRLKKKDRRSSFFLFTCAICSVITLIGFYNAFAKRIALYFMYPFSIFFFTTCAKCFTRGSRLAVNVAVIVYQVMIFFISAYLLKQADLIPYNSIFGL